MSTLRAALQDLVARRYTQTEIADGAKVSQSSISRFLAGSGIDYDAGKRIEMFYDSEKANDFRRSVAGTNVESAAA